MITVSILINGQPIYTRSASNITAEMGGTPCVGLQTYELDTGQLIKHKFEDKAIKLAIKMLKTIKDV